MRFTKYHLLSTAVLLTALQACGGSDAVSTLPPVDVPSEALQVSQSGSFSLAQPTEPVAAAAQVRLMVDTPETLPPTIEVQGVPFVLLPVPVGGSPQVFVPRFDAALQPLSPIREILIEGVTQAQVSATVASLESSSTNLIFQGDPTEVTFEDFVLVLALSNLPPNLRTPENIATQANTLFAQGNFAAADLDPIPNEFNTDFAAGGSTPAPDLTDAAVVYAATFLPANLRTAENIALTVNALLPGANLEAADILAIPGQALPGGLAVDPPVGPVTAGTLQISVQVPNFAAPSFTVGAAEYVRLPNEIFPGFTSYVPEPGSVFLTVEFSQLDIPGADQFTCVIVHTPGQDPLIVTNQIATTAACDTDTGLVGTEGDDTLIGTPAIDTIDGLGGNDTINGLAESDQITTGSGNDSVVYDASQLGSAPDQLSDWDVNADAFQLDATDFNVIGNLSVFNDVAANLPAGGGLNVIVLQDTEDPNNPGSAFNAGAAADLIAAEVSQPGAGFFIYWNSGLMINRLVYSENLADPEAAFTVLANINTLSGQDAINALPSFDASNFALINENLGIVGSNGDDTLNGTGGNDSIDALEGNDTINGLAGSDRITSGPGSDTLVYDASQLGSGPDQLSDWSVMSDQFLLNAGDFNVTGSVSFFNDVAANLPTGGVNVIVLQDIDDGTGGVFNARAAARLIGAEITQLGAGFFIYWNSNLAVNRLVFSEDLSNGEAPLTILNAINTVNGQEAIDVLPVFAAGNFAFENEVAAGADTDVVINEVLYTSDESGDFVELKNTGSSVIDISEWWFCFAVGNYVPLSSLTVTSGNADLVLDPGEIIVFAAGQNLDDTAADLGLYSASAPFNTPENLVDFVKWGSSAQGNGRADVAVAGGFWTEVEPGVFDFVPTAATGEALIFDGENGGSNPLESLSSDFLNGPPTPGADANQ